MTRVILELTLEDIKIIRNNTIPNYQTLPNVEEQWKNIS